MDYSRLRRFRFWRKIFLTVLLLPLVLFQLMTDGDARESSYPQWSWPTQQKVPVLRGFDKPAQRWSPGHRGVDLSSQKQEILSPESGRVVFSGKVVDRTVITLEHPGGYRSSFEPVVDPLPVGSTVTRGQKIAEIDPAIAHCAQACIHWGVRKGTGDRAQYLNPLLFLGEDQPSVLLPLGEDFSAAAKIPATVNGNRDNL